MIIEKPKVVQFRNDKIQVKNNYPKMIKRSELAKLWGWSIGTVKNYTDREYDPLPMEKTTAPKPGQREIVQIPYEVAMEWKERNTTRNYEVRA